MNRRIVAGVILLFLLALPFGTVTGCKGDKSKKSSGEAGTGSKSTQEAAPKPGAVPHFVLLWSEYPSWSVFGVAHELKLINGKKGELGTLEKKWKVDIELELLEYGPCLDKYASKSADAVCITNIDIMPQLAKLRSVAILPTSTSAGADACLVTFDISDKAKAMEELKKIKVWGLADSVSEYAFVRNLEKLKLDPKDYKFAGEEPLTASTKMAQKAKDHQAIMVWNPFVLEVLDKNPEARRLFDSSSIPEEIIDMVVVAEDSLKKEKGDAFAACIIDVYYEVNKLLRSEDQKEADKILTMLGEKFTTDGKSTKLDKMKICVKETRFYKTPDEGLTLFTGKTLPETMKLVTKFCKEKEMIKQDVTYVFGEAKAGETPQLRFDPSYMQKVKAAQK